MTNLKTILDSEEAYKILDSSKVGGGTWMAGGCAILAKTLHDIYKYPIYTIYNTDKKIIEHFGVKTQKETYIDYDGEHKDWISDFKNAELIEGNLKILPYKQGMNMKGIVFDDNSSDKLKILISNHQYIKEIVKSVFKNVLDS